MSAYTDKAKGQECQIRVPGVCNFDPEKTVPCHLRMAGITGVSLKADDLLVAWGCSDCHDYVDGRTHKEVDEDARRLLLLDGIARTIAIAARRGWVKT